jgi:exodeoxyribonuclease VII large subunit
MALHDPFEFLGEEQTGKQVYKVSEITSLIKGVLEESFGYVSVEGEISNFRPSSTGHYYFTLKDDQAVISVVMFKSRIGKLTFEPADGKLVVVEGNLSVYPKRGSYQIICESMQPAGEGNILAMLEERKRKLAVEGLFDEERKKPLPLFPSRAAVVTSPTGAAIRDILRVLRRRNSGLNLVIVPAPVQGENAGERIAAQIRRVNRYHLGEVLIVGRGGGSLEDLLPFSDEVVVRAIAESEIPVISAVGHEIDSSLSDYASDKTAATPSMAAEIVSTSREELIQRIREQKNGLIIAIERRVERISLLLRQFRPEQLQRSFRMIMQPVLMRLDDLKEELIDQLKERITEYKHTLEILEGRLEGGSPLTILKRGYALVTAKESGRLVTSAGQTTLGEEIRVRFSEDRLTAVVEEDEKDDEKL